MSKERSKYEMDENTQDSESITAVEEAQRAADDGRVIYFAPAKEYQIANYRKEVKQAGDIISTECPWRFSEHLTITDEDEVIEFIEKSNAFKAGIIKRCKNREEANQMVLGARAMKGVKEAQVQDISSTLIDARG